VQTGRQGTSCGAASLVSVALTTKFGKHQARALDWSRCDFQPNEVVMVERPLMLLPPPGTKESDEQRHAQLSRLSASEMAAFRELAPAGGTDLQKYNANACDCCDVGPGVCGIFLAISRANHDCLATCSFWRDKQNVQRLVALRAICAGEEIAIAYTPETSLVEGEARKPAERRAHLKGYGFCCACTACTDSRTAEKVARLGEVHHQLEELLHSEQFDAAMRAGEESLQLIDEPQLGPAWRTLVYGDLFQVAILREATLPAAKRYAALCAEHAAAYYGAESETAVEYRRYANQPEAHFAYCVADKEGGFMTMQSGPQM
jgi:SET domain